MKVLTQIKALDQATQLSQRFHVGWNFITALNTSKPDWKTNRKYPLTRGEFVKRYNDELTLLGVGFGTETKYLMLDIDRGSKYHPYNDLKAFKKVCQTLEKVGLVSFDSNRSSDSEGIHVYFHLPYAVNTFRLAALVHVTLIDAGIDFRDGQLESFPNAKPYGDKDNPTYHKPHRLPLQPSTGGLLLDQDGDVLLTAENVTHDSMLAGFLRRAEISAAEQDMKLLERKMNWAYDLYKSDIGKYQYHHQKLYSHVAQEWKENLELTISIGWTGYHQTNTLLPNFVAYGIVFLGLKGEALSQWMYDQIVATRGYHEYCRHKHEIHKVIKGWVDNTERRNYYVEYCGFPARSGVSPFKVIKHIKVQRNEHNESLIERTKQRLTETLAALAELPRKLTDRVIAIVNKSRELFGQSISRNTLYKPEYKSLWSEMEIEAIKDDLQKNPTPPPSSTQVDNQSQNQPIESEEVNQKFEAEPQSQTALYHTPPLYETFVDLSAPPLQEPNSHLNTYPPSGQVTHLSSYTKHYNLPDTQVVTQLPSKFAVLVELVAKLIPVAAIVAQVGLVSIDSLLAEAVTTEIEPAGESISDISATVVAAGEPDLHALDSTILPEIIVGSQLRRNAQKIHGKDYPALVNCEVVAVNGVDWTVRSACGVSFNVSPYSIESGLWSIESSDRPDDRIVSDPPPMVPLKMRQVQPDRTDICPECEIFAPPQELENWAMCRFCAQKILWRRLV